MAQDFISAILGAPPDYSNALTPQQTQQMRTNAMTQGGIGALIALLGASGPQPKKIGTGQALAGALGAGFGGYQSSFDNTLKQMLTAQQLGENKQKQDARKRYEQAIASATTRAPTGIGLTDTGVGSQLQMLRDQTADFGTEGANITAGALMSNPNLPMQEVVDPVAAQTAALNLLRDTDIAKYLELTTPKATETPSDIRSALAFQNLTPEQQQTYLRLKTAGAPKTILEMTTGQKGFDNEMGLKKQFSAEPVYKAYGEMQSAYSQITDSLKAASPAGDLAAATKFMKLLDPGSVVRESELGMAMAASGALDRAVNYAQLRLSGEKLTPTQREDFAKLSKDLFSAATTAYNTKRGEYEQMGAAFGLDANRALGAPAKLPAKNIKVNY